MLFEEEMRDIDKCELVEFCALDSSDQTIAILVDRKWPEAAK